MPYVYGQTQTARYHSDICCKADQVDSSMFPDGFSRREFLHAQLDEWLTAAADEQGTYNSLGEHTATFELRIITDEEHGNPH